MNEEDCDCMMLESLFDCLKGKHSNKKNLSFYSGHGFIMTSGEQRPT